MSRPLEGVRVAITENRYPQQLSQLLEREGAVVHSCPLLRETAIEDALAARRFAEVCDRGDCDYIVFYTGVGVDFLSKAVNGCLNFRGAKVVARGPKAVSALTRAGVPVDFVADAPTTDGIIRTLLREDLHNKRVLVQLYGQDNPELAEALQQRGATVTGISLYTYTQASNTESIQELIQAVADRNIDVLTFTSATQVPFFFRAALESEHSRVFRERFGRDLIVAAVGEVTARALRREGVDPDVVPEEPKMGPMVKAIARFFESRRA